MTFSEQPVCQTGNSPIINDNPCPPVPVAPIDRTNVVRIVMGSTTYQGTLTSDWTDRINRLNTLSTTIIRLILAFQDSTSWLRSRTFFFRNPYNVAGREASRSVSLRGFPLLLASLDALHQKIDQLHDDLPRIEAVASIVEHWQIKPEAERPFCAFLFGELDVQTGKIGSGKWQVSVPHANFAAITDLDNNFGIRKGDIQFLYTMSDNSKIIFYCHDRSEGEDFLDQLLTYVPAQLKSGAYLKVGDYKGPPFKDVVVKLRRVDWYERGLVREKPTFYRSYPNVLNPNP